ncbi:glycosyltransferase family 1 protein [Candidatus Thorarchaeota archaeon]|nr:MAG: glycosyltransferase family 1 protein [Candidatus Thorarchaeota archaeon]
MMILSLRSHTMRVLHLCDSLNPAGLGGYESYLHYLSMKLDIAGHQSVITSQKTMRNAPNQVDCDYYQVRYLEGNLLEARKWEYLALPPDDRVDAARELFFDDDLEENVEILTEELVSLVEEFRPDVVHAHSTYVVFNRVLERCSSTSMFKVLPLPATVHGLPKPLILPDGTETTDYSQLAAHCPFDTVFGVSVCVATELRAHLGTSFKRIRREYLGVDLDVFRPLGLPKRWDIAFMGRMEPMKSVDLFPDIFQCLVGRNPSLRIVMTGEGSCREEMMGQFSEGGMDENVEYLGVVANDRVSRILDQSTVFLYPSRREPFGLSIVEAMACQLPVVTSNVFGPKEIVTDNRDGILVDPEDVDMIADALWRLLDDSERRTSLGRRARVTAERRFNLDHHVERLLASYRAMMAEKKR